jgi:hypothetical protein
LAFFKEITCIPNLIFVEVKSPVGRQSEDQKRFEALCAKANIPYILARSLDDIQKYLK